MRTKQHFSRQELVKLLSLYPLGEYTDDQPLTAGTVQTNILIHTSTSKVVFRYYNNRSVEEVLFESDLIQYLIKHHYPCPAPIPNQEGQVVGIYQEKPYIIFEYMEGAHIEHPNDRQKEQLIQKVAELHRLTHHYQPVHIDHRLNYGVDVCRSLAEKEARRINTPDAMQKLRWLKDQLGQLQLPPALPKGVCHADFHFTNVLFKENRFHALLDFDDANYTYLIVDLVGLMEHWAWRHDRDQVLQIPEARNVISRYERHRPLEDIEKQHLFDVYQLSILIDCVWFFGRGTADNFYEKRKINHLDQVGRDALSEKLFG